MAKKPHKMVNGEKVPMTDEEIAFMEQEHAERAAEKPLRDIIEQIQKLESQQTPRRVREAILGNDNGWLADINAQINTLRQQL